MRSKDIYVTKASLPEKEAFFSLLEEVFDSAWLTNMGSLHQRLEKALKEYMQTEHISLFVNGHLALELLLQALALRGEVITTPFSFVSTTHAIVRNGLQPVFCDIREEDFTIDPDKIEALITDKTAAILAVHVYGNICAHERLEKIAGKYGLKLIYDAAHAFGEYYGKRPVASLGDASMFSFHATKVYHTIEGGAVSSADAALHEKLYFLKNFGIADKENVELVGSNAKMNEFQAAMGLCNLGRVDEWMAKRKKIAERYRENLQSVKGLRLPVYKEEQSYNYAYFPLLLTEGGGARNALYKALEEQGIHTRKYFYPCINDLKCYKDLYEARPTPLARRLAEQVLTLPIYPDLDLEEVDTISARIRDFCRY